MCLYLNGANGRSANGKKEADGREGAVGWEGRKGISKAAFNASKMKIDAMIDGWIDED